MVMFILLNNVTTDAESVNHFVNKMKINKRSREIGENSTLGKKSQKRMELACNENERR
jgi:hypothetical protein